MAMRKVCPKCKTSTLIQETAWPSARITTMEMIPKFDEHGKILVDICEADVVDSYCDFDGGTSPIYECGECGYEYFGEDYEECWNEMVWRKR